MGKFVNFFKRIGSGIKKGATKVWNWSKNAVGKVGNFLRPIADTAAKIGGAMSMLPGKAGAIGTGLAAGGTAIKNITDMLPNSAAKDKINNAIDKAVDTGQGYINKGIDYMNNINNKVQPWIDSGVKISRTIADNADKLHAKFPQMQVFKGGFGGKLYPTVGGRYGTPANPIRDLSHQYDSLPSAVRKRMGV